MKRNMQGIREWVGYIKKLDNSYDVKSKKLNDQDRNDELFIFQPVKIQEQSINQRSN